MAEQTPATGQSLIQKHGDWESVYRDLKPEELPWNAGAPDSQLVALIESGKIPVGRAIDLGAGPGHDAIYLARKGFRVLAVDIAPAAIALAHSNAKQAGLERAIDFRVEDVLKLSSPAATASFVNDRGCFHVLDPENWATYVRRISNVLAPGGHLFLRTFSDQEPPGPGPHRFSRKELEDVFSGSFTFLDFKEGIFEGSLKPKAYVCLLQKPAK